MCLDMCLGIPVWCMHVPGHVSGRTCTDACMCLDMCLYVHVWMHACVGTLYSMHAS